jgi:N-methylhydantoinase A
VDDALAHELGTDRTEAAYAVYSTVNQLMVGGIEAVTIREGVDPHDTTLVGGGGACGVHVAPIAEELGMTRVLVPAEAGTLSAFGAVVSDITHEFSAARYARSTALDLDELNRLLAGLAAEAGAFLLSTGRPKASCELTAICEARYVNQIWELDVELPDLRLDDVAIATLLERFHAVHERTYGYSEPDQAVEFLQWRVRGTAKTADPRLAEGEPGEAGESERLAYFGDEHGWLPTAALSPARARELGEVPGPAVVHELTTTILVPPGWHLTVHAAGYLLERTPERDHSGLELASGVEAA